MLLLLPIKILVALIRLLLRIILFPLKLIGGGCLFQAGTLLILAAIIVLLVYFIYHWLT